MNRSNTREWTTWVAMVLLAGLAQYCSTPHGEQGKQPVDADPEPTPVVDRRTVGRVHSTLADTLGMAADLRIIERRLGRLDPNIREELVPVEVSYLTFTDATCSEVDTGGACTGIIIVHRCIAEDVRAIFKAMLADRFPIAKVIPVNRYGLNADSTGWNDAASMADNNTSAFNHRGKPTSRAPSKHAQGIAIDINPLLNPMVHERAGSRTVDPPQGRYDPERPGTLTRENTTRYLKGLGWSWGGRWPRPQDYQHIEKSHGRCAHFRFSLQ